MFSCKSAPKLTVINPDRILGDLRSLQGLNLSIKLNDYKLDFNEKTGDWRTNLNEKPIFDEQEEKRKEKIVKMKEESAKLDDEIEKLEKEYLASVSKLMIMAYTHCELKADIVDVFDHVGIDGGDVQ